MSGASTAEGAQAAAGASAPAAAAQGEDTQKRLMERVPAFVADLFGPQNRGSKLPGVFSFHYQDGEVLDEAVQKVMKLWKQESGEEQEEEADGSGGTDGQAAAPGAEAGDGKPRGGTLGQQVAEGLSEAAGEERVVQGYIPGGEEEECSECGKRAAPGVKFPACAHCGMPYCSKSCQAAAWPGHKAVCRPEKLRPHVPSELAVLQQIKREATGLLVDGMALELSLAAVAWEQRLGRGMAVVCMENFAFLASRSCAGKCQVFAFFIPEQHAASWAPHVPGLQQLLASAGGVKKYLRSSIPAETHAAVAFVDLQGYGVLTGLPILPGRKFCQQSLDAGSIELREFDVLCTDTVSGDTVLLDFHSVHNVASVGPA